MVSVSQCCGLPAYCEYPARSGGWVVNRLWFSRLFWFQRYGLRVAPLRWVLGSKSAPLHAAVSTGMFQPHTERHNTVLQYRTVQDRQALLSHTHASRHFIPHQLKRTRSILSFIFRICTADSNESVSPVQRFKIRHIASPRHRTNTSVTDTAVTNTLTACLPQR